jgi:hypothetical protein
MQAANPASNQDAIVQEVSKGRKLSPVVARAGNLDLAPAIEVSPEQPHPVLAFTTEAEIHCSIETRHRRLRLRGPGSARRAGGYRERARGRV